MDTSHKLNCSANSKLDTEDFRGIVSTSHKLNCSENSKSGEAEDLRGGLLRGNLKNCAMWYCILNDVGGFGKNTKKITIVSDASVGLARFSSTGTELGYIVRY